jgi:hypothetical protein
MFGSPQSVEIYCDAPSYPVVEACEGFGFHSPWDVRWLCVRHLPNGPAGEDGLFNVRRWLAFFGVSADRVRRCSCGRELPPLRRYDVPAAAGVHRHYWLGQCPRCDTIYWQSEG